MQDYRKALADIEDIRSSLAASTVFRGLGPAALAATAGLALGLATLQTLFPVASPLAFFLQWIAVALLGVVILGAEMIVRSRRRHSGMADAMIYNAVQQFLPAGMAGAAFAVVIARFAPENAWMLPGIWQVLVSLGLFAAARSLPRGAVMAGGWYFVAGVAVLALGAGDRLASPWDMGVPFAVGQLLLAAIIHAGIDDDRI